MNIGLYFRTAHPVADAIAAGFSGHTLHYREPSLYKGEVEAFDLVIANGWRDGKKVAKAYTEKDIPVLTVDFGYMNRVNAPDEYMQGHWQVGLNGLNKIPAFDCPPDRFDALGLGIAKQGGSPKGCVLVCGQVGNDAAHGLGSHGLRSWLREQLEAYPDSIFRPHPRGGIAVPGYAGDTRPLQDALDNTSLVVTYNSNVGHDALLAGVPVVCAASAYQELSGEDLPSIEIRKAYFNRLAYAQWTAEEMASGIAQEFWLNHLIPGKGFANQRDPRDIASDPEGMLVVKSGEPLIAAPANDPVDYSKLKVSELRDLLSGRGIEFPSRATKAELIKLLG